MEVMDQQGSLELGAPQLQAQDPTIKHLGHCGHCGGRITARTSAQWHKLVRGPCPHCGRKGW